jgi:hypothetical protein
LRRSCLKKRSDKITAGLEPDRGEWVQTKILARGSDGASILLDPADPEKTLRVLTLYAICDMPHERNVRT